MMTLPCTAPDRSLPFRTARVVCAVAFAASVWTGAGRDADAQQGATRVFHVRENMGIRRTEYPVSVTVPLPKGALADTSHVRLMTNSAEVAGQFTARTSWDDGSVQTLDVDFNASLDPEEDRRFELQFGPAVTTAAKPTAGLTVTDQPDAIIVGKLRFTKNGNPLLSSVSYRGEGIGAGANGLTLTDQMGRRHDLSKAQGGNLEVVKPGPLLVVLKYTASLQLDETTSIPIELLMEMPNSKTWLKTSVTVTDRGRKLKDLAVERPYAFAGFPVLWDFGTDSGTYGVFRAAADTITLTQAATAGGSASWKVESGPASQRRVMESSATPRNKNASGWGHLQDAQSAVAFGVGRFGKDAGTSTIALSGSGQVTFRFQPAAPTTQLQMTVFEHFVGTPVAIGAATNPTAMLNPPSVTVER